MPLEDQTKSFYNFIFPSIKNITAMSETEYSKNNIKFKNIGIYGKIGEGKTETVRRIVEEAVQRYGNGNVNARIVERGEINYLLRYGLDDKLIQILFCVDPYSTYISSPYGNILLKDLRIGDIIYGISNGKLVLTKISNIISNIYSEYQITHLPDRILISSLDHPIYTDSWTKARFIDENDELLTWDINESIRSTEEVYKRKCNKNDYEKIIRDTWNKYGISTVLHSEIWDKENISKHIKNTRLSINKRRMDIPSRNNRWRRNRFNSERKKQIYSSNNPNIKHGFKFNKMAIQEVTRTNYEKSTEKAERKEVLLWNCNNKYGKSSNCAEQYSELFDYEKETRNSCKEMDRTQNKRSLEQFIYNRRVKDLSSSFIPEFSYIRNIQIERRKNKKELWDVTTGTGNFFANGILVHNCDNLTLAKIRDSDIKEFFQIRQDWYEQIKPRNVGYIISILSFHRFYAVPLTLRTYMDAIIWKSSATSPFDFNTVKKFIGEEGIEFLENIELRREEDYTLKKFNIFNIKRNIGILITPLATKNYLLPITIPREYAYMEILKRLGRK